MSKNSKPIDLNLNLGEHYGFGREAFEKELLPYASSVNIASGAHAGDAFIISESLKLCKDYPDLSVGALISYPDVIGFGSRKITLSSEELRASIVSQLGSITSLAKFAGYEINHIRVHGHLYFQMMNNYSVAETVIRTVQEFNSWFILVVPYAPNIREIANWVNLRVSYEARVDLRYNTDGQVIPYDSKYDSDVDIETISARARNLILDSKVISSGEDTTESYVSFETLHLPSTLRNSLDIAKLITGMIPAKSSLKSFDYEPYLSEFI